MYTPKTGSQPRIFIALWPDDGIRQAMLDVIDRFSEPRARWVKPENLHMTLAFLGNVPAERIQGILEHLSKVEFPAFDFVLDYVFYGHRSQMLWLTPKQRSEPLLALVESILERVEQVGFNREKRPFAPHITVARNMKTKLACQAVTGVRWMVSSFCLVESETGKGGSRYLVRQRWPADSKI